MSHGIAEAKFSNHLVTIIWRKVSFKNSDIHIFFHHTSNISRYLFWSVVWKGKLLIQMLETPLKMLSSWLLQLSCGLCTALRDTYDGKYIFCGRQKRLSFHPLAWPYPLEEDSCSTFLSWCFRRRAIKYFVRGYVLGNQTQLCFFKLLCFDAKIQGSHPVLSLPSKFS